MAASRLTYPDKTNNPSDPDSIRKFFATEATEIKEVAGNHADLLDAIDTRLSALELSQSSNPFYGRYSSLAILQAAYPVGELDAWAVIDAGAGITPLIAIWDDVGGTWEISGYKDNTIEVANYAALPAPGLIGKWYVVKDEESLYRWFDGSYHLMRIDNVQTTNSNKLTLVASEADQVDFIISSTPPNIDIVYNDAWLTEGYHYNYFPISGTIILLIDNLDIPGLQIGEELNVRTYGDNFDKQIIIATSEDQVVFYYSGSPSNIEVIVNDGILTEGYGYNRTIYTTGNYITLTEGVPNGSSVQINKF